MILNPCKENKQLIFRDNCTVFLTDCSSVHSSFISFSNIQTGCLVWVLAWSLIDTYAFYCQAKTKYFSIGYSQYYVEACNVLAVSHLPISVI